MSDEYNTSKCCPCGGAELTDVNVPNEKDSDLSGADTETEEYSDLHKSCRYRCHKHNADNDKPTCEWCIENVLGSNRMGRDFLAVVNMLTCAKNALTGKKRPRHLCRVHKPTQLAT